MSKKETNTKVVKAPEKTNPEVIKTFPVFAIKENTFIFVSEAEFDKTNHKLV